MLRYVAHMLRYVAHMLRSCCRQVARHTVLRQYHARAFDQVASGEGGGYARREKNRNTGRFCRFWAVLVDLFGPAPCSLLPAPFYLLPSTFYLLPSTFYLLPPAF